jgi:hypothetical protein
MIEFSNVDLALREIGNGIWSCLALLLAAAFARYAWRNRLCRSDLTAQGACALALYFTGSSIRAFLGWGAIASTRREWTPDPWANSWPWYVPSLFISVVGGGWCLWIFTPVEHRKLVMILFAAALVVPVVFYLSHS